MLRSIFPIVFLGVFLISCSEKPTVDTSSDFKLVWSDEFDKDGLPDPSKWSYDFGNGCPHLCGWGNREVQFYTKENPRNSRIENGVLIIEAHKEKIEKSQYSSARLVTKGKGDFKYGRFDIRAKLPSGRGSWPAIWMLPTNKSEYGSWPKCGEIDIMEHVGFVQDSVYGTVHTEAFNHKIHTQKGEAGFVPNAESVFHTYSIVWDENKIEWLVDDQKYFEFLNEKKSYKEWPFDQKFHLIMNIAIGGFWGGQRGIDTEIWPQRMEIDFVRVFQKV